MSSEFVQQYLNLEKEQLLGLDSEILTQLRNEMGDQAFIDKWELTQEEYSFLINEEQGETTPAPVEQNTLPVNADSTIKALTSKQGGTVPLGHKLEILYPTRKEEADNRVKNALSSLVTSSFLPPKETTTATPAPIQETITEERSNVWTSEHPAYQIVRSSGYENVATTTTTTTAPAPVTNTNTDVWTSETPAYEIVHNTPTLVETTTETTETPVANTTESVVIPEARSYIVRHPPVYHAPLRASYVAPTIRASYVAPTTEIVEGGQEVLTTAAPVYTSAYPAHYSYGYPHVYGGYGYPYHHGYYGAPVRRISHGNYVNRGSIRASSYVVGNAPLRTSVLRSSYAGPVRYI